jgi:pyridoxal phosphate enzyme (YggS family)
MPVSIESIARNVERIRTRIADAAAESGRDASDVRLIAVSKYVGADEIRALHQAGCTMLGESRPQALWEKAAALEDLDLQWHFIGNLQRNKVRRTMPLVTLLHAGDSVRLLQTIENLGEELDRDFDVLLEVNISGDETKHGFTSESIESSLGEIASLNRVHVKGLMAMASLSGGASQANHDFEALRILRDRLQLNAPDAIELTELSMGMSGDFEAAIRHGSTMVRVGSALFEES